MANAYIYKAALLCEECALTIRHKFINRTDKASMLPAMVDSDQYPHGPYTRGGGAADTPQHCGNCQTFLENPLTSDGLDYVREMILLAARTGGFSGPVLAQWKRFYGDALRRSRFDAIQASSGYLNMRRRELHEVEH